MKKESRKNIVRLSQHGSIRLLHLPVLDIPGMIHGFGTRDLGKSPAPAMRKIKELFPDIRELIALRQQHGTRAVVVTSRENPSRFSGRAGDIIISLRPGIAAVVRTADCAPVLIADPETKAAAAVHAGWRGTAKAVVVKAVEALCEEAGATPSRLHAGIGPCIMPCHYQVDDPVIEAMSAALGKSAARVFTLESPGKSRPGKVRPGKVRLDLALANRILLERAGLRAENIQAAGMCTYCREDLFFSYRREGRGVPSLYHFIARVE